VKTPLVYTSVAIRNWTAFQKLGISGAYAPGGYHTTFALNWPVDIGGVTAERSPDKPILVHMQRTPCRAGLPEFDQNKAGRAELLATSFETFERNIRDQLGRALGPGGFDPANDITGITVNRWPHGYAPEWNALWDEPLPEDQQPNVIGRQRVETMPDLPRPLVTRLAVLDLSVETLGNGLGVGLAAAQGGSQQGLRPSAPDGVWLGGAARLDLEPLEGDQRPYFA